MEFDAKINDVKPDIESVLSACKELRGSQKFVDILKIVLEIGNFLNGNSFREGAWGFKLDTLAAMVDTKVRVRICNCAVVCASFCCCFFRTCGGPSGCWGRDFQYRRFPPF